MDVTTLSDRELEELRRDVLNEQDRRLVKRREEAQEHAELVEAVGAVRNEVARFLRTGGDTATLLGLVDTVVDELRGNSANHRRNA